MIGLDWRGVGKEGSRGMAMVMQWRLPSVTTADSHSRSCWIWRLLGEGRCLTCHINPILYRPWRHGSLQTLSAPSFGCWSSYACFHPLFLQGLDWDALEARKMPAPRIPKDDSAKRLQELNQQQKQQPPQHNESPEEIAECEAIFADF